jgi:hypothetical protein
MLDSRRKFLGRLSAAGLAFGALAAPLFAQHGQSPKPPGGLKDDDITPPAPATKAILESNNKEIKKAIEKLYELAGDLKTEVEKTDSAQVLSLAMIKKAEEIEKLAKDIKSRAKG